MCRLYKHLLNPGEVRYLTVCSAWLHEFLWGGGASMQVFHPQSVCPLWPEYAACLFARGPMCERRVLHCVFVYSVIWGRVCLSWEPELWRKGGLTSAGNRMQCPQCCHPNVLDWEAPKGNWQEIIVTFYEQCYHCKILFFKIQRKQEKQGSATMLPFVCQLRILLFGKITWAILWRMQLNLLLVVHGSCPKGRNDYELSLEWTAMHCSSLSHECLCWQ